jgi:serine/threonine-protein kinase
VADAPSSKTPESDYSEFIRRIRSDLKPELEVLRPLGSSAVSEILLAREPALTRLVAVKILSPAAARDSGTIRRFEREAQSAGRIAHPNVVTVYRVGSLSDGLPFLVMQYVKGRSLEDLVEAQGPFDLSAGCELLATVTSAIAAGHRRNVIHRDINPSNVLIEATTGRVVVIDFGLSAILATGDAEPARITTTGHIIGNPKYMSPERLRGESADESSDVYSLAFLAYHVLAAHPPFNAASDQDWAVAHMRSKPVPISSLAPAADQQLDDLLLRCLAKERTHRPSTADLEAAMRSYSGPERATRQVVEPAPGQARAEVTVTGIPPAPGHLTGPTDHEFRLDLLGKLDLTNKNGTRVLSIVAQPKRIALLAYLASGHGEPLKRRDRIVSSFWPDVDADKGRHALRQALYVLRGSLGAATLINDGDEEVGIARDRLWSDVTAFEEAIDADRPDVAMGLYRGPLLPGFYLSDVIGFEHWLDRERVRLQRLATRAASRLAADREGSGDAAAALHWGRRAAELAPFDELVLRQLLRLHARLGDRAGALFAFETFSRRLREELEAEPMEETVELVSQIRAT